MASLAEGVEDRSVSIGRIFSRGFSTISHNPAATLGVAFLLGALPSLAINYFAQLWQADLLATLGTSSTIILGVLMIVAAIAFAMVTQGALVRAVIAESEGRTASLGECLTAGMRVILPLLGLGIISAFGIGIGFVLLIVPGVMLYMMWAVAAPALVDERLGIFEALGRSRALTSGARWKIFGMILIMIVIYWLFAAAIGVVTGMSFGDEATVNMLGQGPPPIGFLIVTALMSTLISAVWGCVQTSLFVELRNWKDGPRSEELAEVFA